VRYCSFPAVLEGVVSDLETLVRMLPAYKQRALNVMLGTLCNDADELARGLADEIGFAWRMFSAVAASKPAPDLETRRLHSAQMWRAWLGRILRDVPAWSSAEVSPRSPAQSAGYIVLVA
jgi:hypothetical protein